MVIDEHTWCVWDQQGLETETQQAQRGKAASPQAIEILLVYHIYFKRFLMRMCSFAIQLTNMNVQFCLLVFLIKATFVIILVIITQEKLSGVQYQTV